MSDSISSKSIDIIMKDQLNWKPIVDSIKKKAISIVIGNDLSNLKLKKDDLSKSEQFNAFIDAGWLEGEYLYINLYKYLPIRLWEIYGKGDLPIPVTLNNVVLTLQNLKIATNPINNFIKEEITQLTNDQIVLEPLRKLARISGFETFITVNIDNFLERAFAAEEKHINISYNFSIDPFPSIDLSLKKDKAIPSIYNLMGSIDGYNFAVTDEQSMEFLFEIQNQRDANAKELFDTISKKDFLFTGSSFPDWFMRFFIRIISNEPYKPQHKAKYVACDSTLDDKELYAFLQTQAILVFPISKADKNKYGDKVYNSSSEFIEDIYKNCNSMGAEKRNEIRYKEKVFISYSRDDKSRAERFRNEFEKSGIHVFFDEDSLQNGDQYNQIIKNYIKDCDYFVALISENAIMDKSRYVYDKEWKSAIVLNDYKDKSYIRPYIIDLTEPTDPRIPQEIRNLNIEAIQDFDALGKTIEKFIRENLLTPVNQ